MPRLDVPTDTAAFAELRQALDALGQLTSRPTVDLVALGKAYQRLASALQAAATENGPPSMRYEAAAKALDLTTHKSSIEAFLGSR